jgi:peptidoglycan DL-endopeptidase CwlO
MYLRFLTVTGMILLACTTLRSNTTNDPNARIVDSEEKSLVLEMRRQIVEYATGLVGTPYRYTGCSTKGFDCSGFTSYVLSNFNLSLPRTSTGQSTLGKPIKFKEAQPGDLLFFGRGNRIQHVAIVVTNDKKELMMVHSSSSHGVIIENVNTSDYWKKRIMFAVDLESL